MAPRSDPETSGLEATAIEVASRALVQALLAASDLAPGRVSGSQLAAMRVIQGREGLNMSQLARGLGTIPSWASRLCDRLEADGYLERRPGPEGGRQVQITLTSNGLRILEQIERARTQALADVLTGMTPSDRQSLRRGLEAFARARAAKPNGATESA